MKVDYPIAIPHAEGLSSEVLKGVRGLRGSALWDTVEAEICRMADEGTLYLTELLQQRPKMRDLAGMILCDLKLNSNEVPVEANSHDYPEELKRYRVKLKCINLGADPDFEYCNKIHYQDGATGAGYVHSRGRAHLGINETKRTVMIKPNMVTLDTKDGVVDVDVKTAWKVLTCMGEGVAYGKRKAQIYKAQRVREIKPNGKAKKNART